jgi:hypothetical protein
MTFYWGEKGSLSLSLSLSSMFARYMFERKTMKWIVTAYGKNKIAWMLRILEKDEKNLTKTFLLRFWMHFLKLH